MTDKGENSGEFADDMAEYLQTFLDETEEQLDDLVDTMLALERDPTNGEDLNEAFRLIHSIKGSAGIMGFENISNLTHHLENRFDQFRSGNEQLDEPTMGIVLRCIDFLRQCVERMRAGQQLASSLELLDELKHLEKVGELSEAEPTDPAAPTLPEQSSQVETDVTRKEIVEMPHGLIRVVVRFREGLQLANLKAQLILTRLSAIGEIKLTRPDQSQLSQLEQLDEFEVHMDTDRSADELRSTVDVDGVESIELSGSSIDSAVEPAKESEADTPELANAPPIAADDSAERRDPPNQQESSPIESLGPSEQAEASEPVSDSPSEESSAPITEESPAKIAETMRVETDRLDNLVNLAGELVVNRARFEQISGQVNPELRKAGMLNRNREFGESLRLIIEQLGRQRGDDINRANQIQRLQDGLELLEQQSEVWSDGQRYFSEIGDAIDQLTRVSQGLQRGVLETRMVPVGPLFNRFKRVVRDLSKDRGKQVNLVIHGEKTELDKRMVDELGDPLVHLIRNSIDHGLETIDQRIEFGKPETGNIFLDASHSGNNVFIQVRDDGAGIDIEKIKSKLIENRLAPADVVEGLTDEQTLEFIWHPGFSTAKQVTDVSGRGVGMDVVKTRIQKLSGTIQIESKPGEGTTFTIRLPLTLAIINCLLVRLRDVIFCMPIADVREIVSIAEQDVITVLNKQSIDVRGEFIPLFGIDDVFHWHDIKDGYNGVADAETATSTESFEVVILQSKGKTIGLRTDEFLGNQDMVVKSLSDNFMNIQGLSGASILGDGGVCLMLDVGKFIEMATH